MAKNNY